MVSCVVSAAGSAIHLVMDKGYLKIHRLGRETITLAILPAPGFYRWLYRSEKAFDIFQGKTFKSISGKHDRPWTAKPVFGKVRSMTLSGLERKFNMQAYVKRIKQL